MEPFFLNDGKRSKEYLAVQEGRNQLCVAVWDLIEGIWPRCKQYLDSDVRTDARENFHQRWWEVYLTHSLLGASVQLVGRDSRPKDGPDLLAQVDGGKLWIEAVAPTAGEGPDAVRSGGPHKAPKPFPEKEIMLRFQQAFSTKVCAHARYVEKCLAHESEGYVIALNGALAERAYPCMQEVPRIVSALLLGLETERVVLEFDETRSRSKYFYEYQPEIEKRSKKTVGLAALRDTANQRVSAVLYSASDAYNCLSLNSMKSRGLDVMAMEFILVLNPHAQVPLPSGFLSAIPRYWVELHDHGFTLHRP